MLVQTGLFSKACACKPSGSDPEFSSGYEEWAREGNKRPGKAEKKRR
jgi:hypothetical protein